MAFEKIQGTNIYVGDVKAAQNQTLMRENNIKVIMNVCNDIESGHKIYDVTYLKWGLDDPKRGDAERNNVQGAAVMLNLGAATAISRGGNILIHCASGNNRCRFVVAMYLYKAPYRPFGFNCPRFDTLDDACIFTKVKDHKDWMTKRGWIK